MRRTYWHLEALDRKPTAYEIVTSKLLYYPERGFEVATPLSDWYARHQSTGLRARDWERFKDPRETTYARYTELQSRKERFVEGVFRASESMKSDSRLSAEWLTTQRRILPTLRFPVHALQMTAAYVGQIAPSGRIVVASAFQAADELRRIEWLAYRTRELELLSGGDLASESRVRWQTETPWQPLRALAERLLVTFDFGEAFIALNAVVKPAFDELFANGLGRRAEAESDGLVAHLMFSIREDSAWQREWTGALLSMCVAESGENKKLLRDLVARWRRPTIDALRSVWVADGGDPADVTRADNAVNAVLARTGANDERS
jgi:toluene monooxygenase system protein E